MGSKFIHIGFGIPYERNYEVLQCDRITSICAKRREYVNAIFIARAYVVNKLFRSVFSVLPIQSIHSYRYSGREYYVYSYSDSLVSLIEKLIDFAYTVHKYCNTRSCYLTILNDVVSSCLNSIEKCIEHIDNWMGYINKVTTNLSSGGRKALYTRFSKRMAKVLNKFYEYFPQGFEIPLFITSYECYKDTQTVLEKFFGKEVSERYANRICRDNSVYLLARDDIFAITSSKTKRQDNCFTNDHNMQCIFIDDYSETNGYIIFKLVNAEVQEDKVSRIRWVALLGYDKTAKQIFLHYVPRTLVLHGAETCRKWLLGIADDFGVERDEYEVIEV
ncbi:MAG: hypothetical protein QXT53_04580 [Ignisphaera sp.]